jgi:hypothetical protein
MPGGGLMSVWNLAASGPRALAVAIAFAAALKFLQWLIVFLADRRDTRDERLDDRERDIETRMNRRLAHVEAELDRYREATMLLVNAMVKKDPANTVLGEVARILRATRPIATLDLDELIGRLGGAGSEGGGDARGH